MLVERSFHKRYVSDWKCCSCGWFVYVLSFICSPLAYTKPRTISYHMLEKRNLKFYERNERLFLAWMKDDHSTVHNTVYGTYTHTHILETEASTAYTINISNACLQSHKHVTLYKYSHRDTALHIKSGWTRSRTISMPYFSRKLYFRFITMVILCWSVGVRSIEWKERKKLQSKYKEKRTRKIKSKIKETRGKIR